MGKTDDTKIDVYQKITDQIVSAIARRFHGRLVTREDILAAGAREADPARYSDDPDAGFVFPDGSTGGFGLYRNGALIQEDGRDLFAAQLGED